MNEVYFEAKGEQLLEKIGLTKAEFARRMGIQRQNVKALFKSKDLRIIHKAAEVMDVPWELLIGYVGEPGLDELPMPTWEDHVAFARQYPGEYDIPEEETTEDPFEIAPEDIPTGDSTEDRRARQKIIRRYYKHWQEIHPEKRMFNTSLNDWIYVKMISVDETSGQASLTYLSTLAVLQLDTIMRDAILIDEREIKKNNGNQKHFKKMLYMRVSLPGLGAVKLMVGVKPRDNSKVQYCITAIDVSRPKKKQGSLK